MLATVLVALMLGGFAGLAPGPYTTMVVGTALERGFRPAAALAFVPFVSDVPPLLATVLLLERLAGPWLTALGLSGGAIVLFVGFRFLRRWRLGSVLVPDEPGSAPHAPQSARFWPVALGTLFSPVPWIFWLMIGSPLLLWSWSRSATEGVIFIAIVFVTNISTATGLAWVVSHSRRVISARWQHRILGIVGAVLLVAGGALVYRALTGDFEDLIDRQGVIRTMVEERLPES